MRFIMAYLIHSRRRPDASLNESAQSLSYTSGCPAFRVHRRHTREADPMTFYDYQEDCELRALQSEHKIVYMVCELYVWRHMG